MGMHKGSRVLMGAVLVGTLCLCGCKDPREYIARYIVTKPADVYLSERRASLSPKVPASATKREGVLTVGLRTSSAMPLVVAAGNEVDGLDVDTACALADELGLRVDFVNVNNVAAALQGPCDVVMSVSAPEAEGFDVLGDYAESAIGLFQHGADAPMATADQVRAARIAIQEGSAAQLLMRQLNIGATEVPAQSLPDAFDMLARGEADFVACNLATGLYMSSVRGGISLAGTIDAPVALGIATSGGGGELRTALEQAYARIQSNGVLASIRRPWLGSTAPVLANMQIQNLVPATEAAVATPVEPPQPGEEIEAGSNAVTL